MISNFLKAFTRTTCLLTAILTLMTPASFAQGSLFEMSLSENLLSSGGSDDLGELTRIYQELGQLPGFEDRVQLHSTETHIVYGVSSLDNLRVPQMTRYADVQVQMHEEFLNESLTNKLAGRLLTTAEIKDELSYLTNFLGYAPGTDTNEPTNDFSMQFSEQPISATISDGQIRILLRADRFITDANTRNLELEIEFVYAIDQENPLGLQRQDDLTTVIRRDGRPLTIRQHILASVIRVEMHENMPSNFAPERLEMSNGVSTDLLRTSILDGWLSLAWGL